MTSWNEIRRAATAFSKRWKNAFDEKSQAQSFLKELFAVFGVDAVTVATFEHRVKFADGAQGFIDCFWPGRVLVEMKSRGHDLDAAYAQAMDYVRALPDPTSLPRAIVVSDFQRFRFYDLAKDNALTEFRLADLRKFVTLFGFMIGAESEDVREQDPVNRQAAEKMARLHDALKSIGYGGRELEVYLVRLLFCLFAEDTSIFKPFQFTNFVTERTAEDGSDLAARLAELFQTLNTPPSRRLTTLDESLAAFPYVNGGLFAAPLSIPAFNAAMRTALLDCARLDWSKISPAIFGAMFQGVMDEQARHDLGAHYTSEENILKVIRPLFLDALREEFDKICLTTGPSKRVKLNAFHERLASLTFLDPACGCGNFLLIAYRELRRLETDLLDELHKDDPAQVLDVSMLCKVSVAQFFGIEIEPFPSEIATVALWLMDHLCNLEVADRFGQYFARIPIPAAAHIVCANALTMDWGELLKNGGCDVRVERGEHVEAGANSLHDLHVLHGQNKTVGRKECFDYVFGNPPFLGRAQKNAEQQAAVASLFDYKDLDFVACWYAKASDLIQNTNTRCAFVSTNSITQGEQVAPLWKRLNVEIDFAYRTFKWHNEAKGNAAVHCVIIGFHSAAPRPSSPSCPRCPSCPTSPASPATPAAHKTIFDSDGAAIPAHHVNGYLLDAPDVIIESRSKPLCDVPRLIMGNMPLDGGSLIIEAKDYADFIAREPDAKPFIKRLTGSREFINGLTRYCLWLKGVSPSTLRSMPAVMERVAKCREMRLASKDAGTRKLAQTSWQFRETNNPASAVVIPKVSSERRQYVPMGFIDDSTIVTDLAFIVPDATLYHFGVLTSAMHNAWLRAVGGRLEMRYRYSKDLVYNTFVWPGEGESFNAEKAEIGRRGGEETASTSSASSSASPRLSNLRVKESRDEIAAAAQAVLDARALYPAASLAELYDPLVMPPELVKAHARLDALVDKAYGRSFSSDSDRVAHLFRLYAEKVEKWKGGKVEKCERAVAPNLR